MNDTPYIHVFRTSEQCYVYDVNTTKILKVPEAVHDYLSNQIISDVDEDTIAFVQDMKAQGFLRSDRVEIPEHPATPLLPFYLKNKMHQLILQVTQKCNLRCSYCTYSGTYKKRTHSSNTMSVEVAERVIDFFIKRTKDSKRVTVSFYGGEPLLNLDLIKHCVDYIETRYYGRTMNFSMTTNGTLLDENVVAFLVSKGFQILISLDGPKETHDRNRRFSNNNEGSFSVIMENVAKIKSLYSDYYRTNVNFNAVSDTQQMFSCVNEFISDPEIFGDGKFMLNYITDSYTDREINVNEEFIADREYELFKFLLSKLGEFPRNKTSYLLDSRFSGIFLHCFQNIKMEQERIPSKFHHSGPCIPGASRLFADTRGNFFPCEQVDELSAAVMLGDIEKGISLKQAEQILNLETTTHSKCKNCWVYRQCTICVVRTEEIQDASKPYKRCASVCKTIDGVFKDYCVLRELGYTFDEERLWGSKDVWN